MCATMNERQRYFLRLLHAGYNIQQAEALALRHFPRRHR